MLLLYGAGVLAAAQLGKLSALTPLMAPALGMGLTAAAWAISLLEIGGATLGAVAGALSARVGSWTMLRLGVSALALAGLGEAASQGTVSLLAWRLLEALGYLGVIVTAPVLIADHAGRAGARVQGLALSLWSSFVPVGLALGAGAASGLAGHWGWRAALLAGGVLAAVLAAALWRLPSAPRGAAAVPGASMASVESVGEFAAPTPSADRSAGAGRVARRRIADPAACLALAFGGFALFEVGMLGLLPTLLVREAGLSAAAAGAWTGVASLSAVGGSAWAAWWMRHGRHGGAGRGTRAPGLAPGLVLGLALPALLLVGVFRPAPAAVVAIGLAMAINLLGGLFAALAFAMLPRVAAPDATGLMRANGWFSQCGATGSLLGPPAMAACVEAAGWPAAAALGLAVSALAVPLAWWSATGVAHEDAPTSG